MTPTATGGCSAGSAATSTVACGRRGATSNSARSPTPSTCSAAFPASSSPVDWDAWGQQYPEPAGPSDREAILDLVLAWEGEASAAIAARWWEQQPEGFFVVRSHDGVIGGFLALLDLTRASAQDIAADPGARAAWDYAAAARSAPADRDGHPVPVHRRSGGLPGPLPDPQRHADPDDAALSGHPEPGLGLPHPGRAGAVGRVLRRRRHAARGRRRLLGGRPPLRAVRPRLPTGPRGRPAGAGDRARPRPGRHAVSADGRAAAAGPLPAGVRRLRTTGVARPAPTGPAGAQPAAADPPGP